jgi:hypothetical protein
VSTVTTKLGLVKPAGPEQFNLATYNNNLDIVDAYAVNTVEKLAPGLKLESVVTTNSGSFSAITIISNIATFTFKANRHYEVVWDGHHQSTVDGDYIDMQIATCAVSDTASLTTGLTVKRQKTFRCVGANLINPNGLRAPVFFGVDTTVQIKFAATRGTGTGSITMIASVNDTMLYQIHDLGAQF